MRKTYLHFSVFIADNQGFEGPDRDLGSLEQWCTLCIGRTDSAWQLHRVPGCSSARRVAIQPPPPPPAIGTAFPVDVLEFLPAFAAEEADPPPISNVVPRRDSNGEILNSHDGNLVQDLNSGAFDLPFLLCGITL